MRFLPRLSKARPSEKEAQRREAEKQRLVASEALSAAIKDLRDAVAAQEAPE